MTCITMSPTAHTAPSGAHRSRQQGRSLIELMVALLVGFVILAGVLVSSTGSITSSRSSNSTTRLEDDAQQAMNILTMQLRVAGYSQRRLNTLAGVPDRLFAGAPVRGCDTGFANTNAPGWNAAVARHSQVLTCGGNGQAALAVLYEADLNNTPASAAGLPTDCLGQSIPNTASSLAASGTGAATVRLAENRYYLGNLSNGTWSLMCAGSGSANGGGVPFNGTVGQAMVSNIEAMTIRYGITQTFTPRELGGTPDWGNVATRYVTAAEVDAAFPGAPDDPWNSVMAIKVCLTVRADTETADEPVPYTNCNNALVRPNDRFLRRTLTSVVTLRNRI